MGIVQLLVTLAALTKTNNSSNYINKIKTEDQEKDISNLFNLQDKGIICIIKSVEIKSEDDKSEVTNAKMKWGKSHFESLNKVIDSYNPIDI